MSPWLCFLPVFSLSHVVTAAPLVHERSYSLQQGLGGSGTVGSKQSSGSTMDELCCYINIYSSLSAPISAFFFCSNHFLHGAISSRKSRALQFLHKVASGFSDVRQSPHYHSYFRQVVRVDQVSNPWLSIELCILSLYFDLAICAASGCLWRHLFSRWRCAALLFPKVVLKSSARN